MNQMNDYARSELRRRVLECRAELRRARDQLKVSKQQFESDQSVVQNWRERIADLQKAAGDPVEIDPSCGDEVL